MCLFTALTHTLREIKPGFGGVGGQKKGQPPESSSEPFRRGFAERRRVVQEDRCAFSNAVELFEVFLFLLCVTKYLLFQSSISYSLTRSGNIFNSYLFSFLG